MSQHQTENKPASVARTLVPRAVGTWAIVEVRGLACAAAEEMTLLFGTSLQPAPLTVSELLG